ncbi:hypothetical protein PL11201_520086 [Planktothrix sp. PCC 11201]|nr:hypothetical protein PL11201_520086 [Planktothrix sp. PCC 11201]
MERVYQDYLSDLKDFVEPAPTGFISIIGIPGTAQKPGFLIELSVSSKG